MQRNGKIAATTCRARRAAAGIAIASLVFAVGGCSVATTAVDVVGTAAETAVDVTATAVETGADVVGKGVEAATDQGESKSPAP